MMGKVLNPWATVSPITNVRAYRCLFAAIIAFLFLYTVAWYTSAPQANFPIHHNPGSEFRPINVQNANQKSQKELCDSFPRHLLKSIQPVLRIGHTENPDKIEAQFDSVSSCFTSDELVVFSDIVEQVHGHQTIDSLDMMPLELEHDDSFKGYLLQKQRFNNISEETEQESVKIDGWAIDRFKFLPMVERIYNARPEKEFYVFYETDSYIFWDNMFRFLKNFDPNDRLYMGSPTVGRKRTSFANGGPGFVLSRGAIEALLHRERGRDGFVTARLVDRWLQRIINDCCGDATLGWALNQVGVSVMGLWPMFNPHALHDIPFGDTHWCQPVLGLHRTTPDDMRKLWKWEFQNRKQNRPIIYSDVWNIYRPGEDEELEKWDNGNWNGWNAPWWKRIRSVNSCKEYCLGARGCVQWHWIASTNQCIGMSSFRYGEMNSRTGPHHSGWVTERIMKFKNMNQCRKVEWVKPSLWRVFSDGARARLY